MTTLHLGDCRDVLKTLEDDSVDSCVTDPPYELNFMGKAWDKTGIAHDVTMWREVLRVLKPGAYLVAAGAPRTHHRLMCAIEDAGFEIREVIMHVFASGFPKSHNVTKALLAMPACRCGVPEVLGEVRPEDAAQPSRPVGTGVGAEPAAVPFAGLATDKADGLGPESVRGAFGRQEKMDGRIEVDGGQLDPVVLGALDVAGGAKSDKVGGDVGVVQAHPESLGDDVVNNESAGCATVSTGAVTPDGIGGDDAPSFTLVSPSAVAPSGIAGTAKPNPIVRGHTGPGAVDGLGNWSGNDVSAGLAGEGVHASKYAAERLVCQTCKGIIHANIPDEIGTALKPAYEPWVLARKPLQGTVAQNVATWGTGALNIGGSRVGTETKGWATPRAGIRKTDSAATSDLVTIPHGRFPANLLHDGSDEVLECFPESTPRGASKYCLPGGDNSGKVGDVPVGSASSKPKTYHGGSSSAARFFASFPPDGSRAIFCAKPSRAERDAGCQGLELHTPGEATGGRKEGSAGLNSPRAGAGRTSGARNHHPTTKPLALMRYLVRLVTPPGGTVLDPFLGSGTTALAAALEGFHAIGIEQNPDYLDIARHRLAAITPALALEERT